jgi:hypothetical protein
MEAEAMEEKDEGPCASMPPLTLRSPSRSAWPLNCASPLTTMSFLKVASPCVVREATEVDSAVRLLSRVPAEVAMRESRMVTSPLMVVLPKVSMLKTRLRPTVRRLRR